MVIVGFLREVVTAVLGSSSTNSSVLPQAAMSATCLLEFQQGKPVACSRKSWVAW
jgi:hypothetical protein